MWLEEMLGNKRMLRGFAFEGFRMTLDFCKVRKRFRLMEKVEEVVFCSILHSFKGRLSLVF